MAKLRAVPGAAGAVVAGERWPAPPDDLEPADLLALVQANSRRCRGEAYFAASAKLAR